MGLQESHSRLRSLFGSSVIFRNVSSSKIGVTIGSWIFVSICLLLIFLHPLSPVKSGHYGSSSSTTTLQSILDDAQNSTLGFQKIMVINLKSRTDRRDRILLGAKLSNIDVDFMEAAEFVSNKSIPLYGDLSYPMGIKGCWRSHMNALQRIVEEDISSALILEDDIDWDVNVRLQFADLARASHVLTHPTPEGQYLDPTWPKPRDGDRSEPVNIPLHSTVVESTHSPYGDEWEMLWLGHCAAALTTEDTMGIQRGHVAWHDQSVPSHQWLSFNQTHLLTNTYPNHTRAVHHTNGNVCTFGYAVTQAAARRMLWHIGIRMMNAPIDLEYSGYCAGYWTNNAPKCLTVEPPYFSIYRAPGNMAGHSDINNELSGTQKSEWSPNVKYSVMQNIDNWVEGRPLVDIAPDDGRP